MNLKSYIITTALLGAMLGGGCSKKPMGNLASDIDASMDRAGLTDVTVSQDNEKGVVTLGGHVAGDDQKARAEEIAKSMAGGQVVANQIAVIPPGAEADAKKVNEALDEGIESNVKAALVAERLDEDIKFSVKNHVVTLTGNVETAEIRSHAAQVAAAVPYVHQVVNELQVRKQKATSTR